jgi:hypothetical protein
MCKIGICSVFLQDIRGQAEVEEDEDLEQTSGTNGKAESSNFRAKQLAPSLLKLPVKSSCVSESSITSTTRTVIELSADLTATHLDAHHCRQPARKPAESATFSGPGAWASLPSLFCLPADSIVPMNSILVARKLHWK